MEIITGLVIAFFGAVIAYAFAELIRYREDRKKQRDESEKMIATLRSEFELNLAIAKQIIDGGSSGMLSPRAGWTWREITPLSEVAWSVVTSNGGLAFLNDKQIRALLEAQAAVIATNYTAKKIQSGQYEPNEGEEYRRRIEIARKRIEVATELF